MWETDADGPQKLFYGNETSGESFIVSAPERIEYEGSELLGLPLKKSVFVHKVWIENLQPDQTYSYRIENTAPQSNSLRTLPADSNEIRFAVYGDSRTNPQLHKRIVEQIIKVRPDFVIHTGDLVSNGNKYEQWGEQFFQPVKGLAENVPIYAIKGNHDGKRGIFEKLLIPAGEEKNSGFYFGAVYYYLADNYSQELPDKELLNLIVENVHSAKAQWKFVSFHTPALNFSGHNSRWCYPNALPMFAKAGADFVISGHSHMYERFKPVEPPVYSGTNFVTYITTGGGGAPLASKPKHSNFYAYADSVLHFCLFHIKGNHLTMDAIDIDGNLIDHLEVSKSDGKLNEEYRRSSMPMAEVLAEQRARKESMMQ
jgi:predicted phosphodiesterase